MWFAHSFGAVLQVRVESPKPIVGKVEILETGDSRPLDSTGVVQFNQMAPDQYTVCILPQNGRETCKEAVIQDSDSLAKLVISGDFGVSSPKDTTVVPVAAEAADSAQDALPSTAGVNEEPDGQNKDYALQKVTVKGKTINKEGLGRQTISQKAIQRLPGLAEPDVMRTVQLLPGVVASSDFSNKLYVRGGAADQNLILLDNAVVYSPSHFGGIFSTFAVNAVKEMEFYKGGFPVRYGNRLSSVLDVKQRNAKEGWLHGYAGVSLLSSKIGLEGNFPRGNWMVGARRTYVDKVTEKMAEANLIPTAIPYYFYDGQARVQVSPFSNFHLSYSFYGGRDFLDFLDLFKLDWGNEVHCVNYVAEISDRIKYRGTLSKSHFNQTAEMARILRMINGIVDSTVKQEITYELDDDHRISAGGEANRFGVDFTQRLLVFEDREISDRSRAKLYAGYLEYEGKPGEKLGLTAGIRGTDYPPTNTWGLEPRLSLTYQLKEDLQWMGHIGHYKQYMTSVVFTDQEMPNEYWYALQGDMPTTYSNLYSAGFRKEVEDNWTVTVEGYGKEFQNLPVFKNEFDSNATVSEQIERSFYESFSTGEGYSFGGEFLIRKLKGFVTGYLGYSQGYAVLNADSVFFANWDKRHSMNLVMDLNWYELKKQKPKLLMSSSLVNMFGSGLPYTKILGFREDRRFGSRKSNYVNLYGRKNNHRYPAYWRIDCSPIRLEYEGNRFNWTFFYSIVNLLDWENVYLYFYDTSTEIPERKEVTMLPRIPIFVGFELGF